MSSTTAVIPELGDPFPDVSLRTLDGEELRVSSLKGKKVLLYMWGSW
ncbi:MAG: redoxin domain-containing protein [Chloroflexota bacterium]|nr:redoxin domain-containing protein [Chloroflexota bacterium]